MKKESTVYSKPLKLNEVIEVPSFKTVPTDFTTKHKNIIIIDIELTERERESGLSPYPTPSHVLRVVNHCLLLKPPGERERVAVFRCD